MKIIYLDVESTGSLPQGPDAHDVVQFAGLVEIDGEVVHRFNYKCRPHRPENFESEALSITGVTMDELMARPCPTKVYKSFQTEVLHKYRNKYDKKDRYFLCAFNASFDYSIMNVFSKRSGDDWFLANFFSPPICVMQAAAIQLMPIRHTMTDFKLGTVCRACDIHFDKTEAHDAMYDIEKTRRLYLTVKPE